MDKLTLLHYLPILTTIISVLFSWRVLQRFYRTRGTHLLWWGVGILCFGLGTLAESWITLLGWNPILFKFWYIVGALLGGAPMAQGTVWLLLKASTARWISMVFLLAFIIGTICIILSPLDLSLVNMHLPNGKVFVWQWVRIFSPIINTYAVIFLVGGALLSAYRFRNSPSPIAHDRFFGNSLIGCGAIFPALGGLSSRLGATQWLYPAELIGLLFMWAGYWFCVRKKS